MTRGHSCRPVWLVLASATTLAGCTAAVPPTAHEPPTPPQPRIATYFCDEGLEIRIENLGGMVRVHVPGEPAETVAGATEADADAPQQEPIELVAAPPGQQSRYGSDGYALVLEGREALWMKAGRAPRSCMR